MPIWRPLARCIMPCAEGARSERTPKGSYSLRMRSGHLLVTECTKVAHRRSLANFKFTADESIAGNSAARIIFTRFHRRKNRGSLAIFFAEEIAHLRGLKKIARFFRERSKSPPQPQRIARFFWCTQQILETPF